MSNKNPSNALSITSIVLGIVAVFLVPIVFMIAGIVCAILAKQKNESLWVIGLVVSIAGGVAGIVFGAIVGAMLFG